ncbi:MAG: DNA-binding response regulator [Dehalococcoidia bacterium]|nr:DNA-binding response regulator [Dehalococcoidia bacterium]
MLDNMEKIRVLVAESHSPLRHTLRKLLENHPRIEVVAEADTEKDAISWAVFYQPDVMLVDGDSHNLDCFRTTLSVKSRLPKIKIVLIADEDNDEYRNAAQNSGASACIAKSRMDKDLVGVIKSILK